MKAIFGLEVHLNTANVVTYSCSTFKQDVEAITEDGAPSGRKEFLLWHCPEAAKASSISEATLIMSYLMKRGVRVILFCKVTSYQTSCVPLRAAFFLD
jgi:ATP-dependent helicase YprA (DUF1998 family)